MRFRLLLVGIAVPALLLGALASSALAGSYPSSWYKIFGHSTSCGLGAASINNTTHKAGGVTENRHGCSHSNAYRSVPPYYLGVQTFIKGDDNYICNYSTLGWNTSTGKSVTRTVPWANPDLAIECQFLDVPYYGQTINYRDTDSDGLWYIQVKSPSKEF